MPRALSKTALPIRLGGAGSPMTSPSIRLAPAATTSMPSPGMSPGPTMNDSGPFVMISVSAVRVGPKSLAPARPSTTFWLMTEFNRRAVSEVRT